jgi:hypothetical protein
MEQEEWKQYPHDKRYLVSNFGNLKGPSNQIMKRQSSGYGYFAVKIRGKSTLVHRIVADTWLPNPNNYTKIAFYDLDKSNPRADNLFWTESVAGRNLHAYLAAKVTNLETQESFHCFNFEIAADIIGNVSGATIAQIVRGKTKNPRKTEGWHIEKSPIPRDWFFLNGKKSITDEDAKEIIKNIK